MEKRDYGGYNIGSATVYNSSDYALNSTDLGALTCSKCALLLKEPCQVISCGHRYCKSCIDHLTSGSDGPYTCLVDQAKFQKHEVKTDKGCQRDLQTLKVDCPTDPPCGWRGQLTQVEIHYNEMCPNKKSLCSLGCGGLFPDVDMETHMTAKCPKRPFTCKYCKGDIPYDTIQEHYGVCEEHPVPCDYCQTELPARKQLSNHLEQDCEEYYMQCSSDTCDFKGRKSEMVQHILAKHLIQSLEKMTGMEKKLKTLESENKTLREELVVCQNTVSDLESKTKKLEVESKQKDVDIVSLKSIVEELQKERDERDLTQIPSRGDLVEKDGVIAKVAKGGYTYREAYPSSVVKSRPDLGDGNGKVVTKYRALEADLDLRALNPMREPIFSVTGVPDVVRPEAVMSQMKQEVEIMQTKLRKMNDVVQSSQESQTRVSVAIDELRLRQDVLDVKTTNGILIWKIPDIRRRFRDAVDRRTISLYSPPFYTSPHGYRMCIRTYLNGDGIGKGTHISLFFVVMRSEQDNLLPWPFKQSVRFTLINQKNPAASITEAFVPDLNSPSFQKPENDMNIASGFPKFARQSVLHDENFTVGNTIYIKCQVDLSGLSAH